MESALTNALPSRTSRSHPLVLAAAASVTVLSLAGTAYLAGWLPGPASPTIASRQPLAATPSGIQLAAAADTPKIAAQPRSRRANVKVTHSTVAPRQESPIAVQRVSEGQRAVDTAAMPATNPVAITTPAICRECGVVESVQEVPVEAKGSGTGAVAGGIVGGILGNQMGRGTTRDIATVLGALGGAYAGNHIEKSMKESKRYDVVVRFEDGTSRTFSGETPPAWRAGDSVRLQNGTLISGGGRSSRTSGAV